eukprot:4072334-Amphidinium_carterae.1
MQLIRDAESLQRAGAFAIVLECVPQEFAFEARNLVQASKQYLRAKLTQQRWPVGQRARAKTTVHRQDLKDGPGWIERVTESLVPDKQVDFFRS